jgi:hypothetical protein
MFEINSYMLNKMGWMPYSKTRGILSHPRFFENDYLVRFFFDQKLKNKLYVIKELSEDEKQKSKCLYNFIISDYSDFYNQTYYTRGLVPAFKIEGFSDNQSLFGFIMKYGACSQIYERNFKLNKILKK